MTGAPQSAAPFELRPHQQFACDETRRSQACGHCRTVVQAPTGAGKTAMAGDFIKGARSKGKRVVFVAPRIQLIDQTVEAFWAQGIREIGVLQGNHPLTNYGMPVQVCSAQTLQKRALPTADLVIIDECHVWFDLYRTWMAHPDHAHVRFIGLSATPWTRGLGKYFQDLVIAATTQDLIDAGLLSGFRVFAPSHPDLTGVGTVAGDYHEGQLSTAMQRPKLIAEPVEAWLKLAEGRPTLNFGVDCAHAQMLRDKFTAAGIPTGYIDAHTPMAERNTIRRQFHDGTLQVVCSVGCLTMGVDWDVRCISLCRPTKSEMLYVQMIGRGLRTAPGKDFCLVLDHSDSTLRLGFVTDIHHTALDDGRRKRAAKRSRDDEERLPKECSSCGALKRPLVRKCWSCGFEPKLISKVSHADGSLVELAGRRVKVDMLTKQTWFSMLTQIGIERRYKPHWAANKYREKFGVWPRGLLPEPLPPNAQVLGFVRSRLIAFAKSQDGAAERAAA